MTARHAIRICPIHKVVYREDDRFPPPCASKGGHEATNPQGGVAKR